MKKAKYALQSIGFMGASAMLSMSCGGITMATSWDKFLQDMKAFFETGLGGPGMEGLGLVIAAIGIVAAIVSFAIHKFNPQSRMPGPIACLAIALVGSVAMSGISKPLELIETVRDTIMGWLGV